MSEDYYLRQLSCFDILINAILFIGKKEIWWTPCWISLLVYSMFILWNLIHRKKFTRNKQKPPRSQFRKPFYCLSTIHDSSIHPDTFFPEPQRNSTKLRHFLFYLFMWESITRYSNHKSSIIIDSSHFPAVWAKKADPWARTKAGKGCQKAHTHRDRRHSAPHLHTHSCVETTKVRPSSAFIFPLYQERPKKITLSAKWRVCRPAVWLP